jgi:epoxide hydrolase-like predicted phosphatase
MKKPIPKNADKIFVQPFLKALVFYPEIFDLVRRLRQKGIKTAVLSNNMETQERLIRERHGYDNFDLVILSNRVGLRKPDPEIYKLAVKKLKVKFSECVYVDDIEKNLIPARELGIKTILVTNPKQVAKNVLNTLSLNN